MILEALKNNVSKISLGFLVSGCCIFLLFKITNDYSEIVKIITSIQFEYAFYGLALYLLSLVVRTIRWDTIIKKEINVDFFLLLRVVTSGYMFNNLLPARLGEIARVFHLNLVKKSNKFFILGTIFTERISDVVALIIFLACSVFILPDNYFYDFAIKSGVPEIALISLLTLLILASLIFISLTISGYWKTLLNKVMSTRFLGHHLKKMNFYAYLDDFLSGTFVLKKRVELSKVLFLAILVWSLEFAMFFVVANQFEFQINNTFVAVLLFGVFANLGGILPSTAGGWGPFELIGSVVLISFGVPENIAVGYTIFVHLILWLPVSIIGIFLFLWDFTIKGNR